MKVFFLILFICCTANGQYIYKGVDLTNYEKQIDFVDCVIDTQKCYCKNDVDFYTKVVIFPDVKMISFVAPKTANRTGQIYAELKELFGRGADKLSETGGQWIIDRTTISIIYLSGTVQVVSTYD